MVRSAPFARVSNHAPFHNAPARGAGIEGLAAWPLGEEKRRKTGIKTVMPQPPVIDIWIHGACAAGGYGGWSYVVREGDQWRGAAGAATRTDAEAMVLTALSTVLEVVADAPASARLSLHLADPAILEASDTQAILRARLAKGLARWPAGPTVIDARKAANPKAWSDFLGSWADFARDKAKTRGAFSAPIPKLNIAKFAQDAI